jgi:CBS domain-containing membrane protein
VFPASADTPRIAFVRALHAAACIGGLAALSYAARTPFLYPSLGATAFLLVALPMKVASSTRNVVLGHTIAAAAGWLSLWALGLNGQQMGLANGCDAPHVVSVALALALTTFLLLTLRIVHPPAGATTVIVGIGLLRTRGRCR